MGHRRVLLRAPSLSLWLVWMLAMPVQAQDGEQNLGDDGASSDAPAGSGAAAGSKPGGGAGANTATTAGGDTDEEAGYEAWFKARHQRVHSAARSLAAYCRSSAENDPYFQADSYLESALKSEDAAGLGTTAKNQLRARGTVATHAGAKAFLKKTGLDASGFEPLTAAEDGFRASVCDRLCNSDKPLNLCALESPVVAAAAILADDETVSSLSDYIYAELAAVEEKHPHLAEGRKLESSAFAEFSASIGAIADSPESATAGIVAAGGRIAKLGLAALARVIADRAKREGVGWFLERVGREVCGADEERDNPLGAELRTHWFPTLCKLADRRHLLQYGAGSELLSSLQGALREDMGRWPAVAGGLGVTLLFRRDLEGSPPPIMQCSLDSPPDGCEAINELRDRTTSLVQGLMRGASAPEALLDYASDLDRINHRDGGWHSTSLQLSACAMSFPGEFVRHRQAVAGAVGQNAAARAVTIGALAGAPACWSVVGTGYERAKLPDYLREKASLGNAVGAWQADEPLERLSTVIHLHETHRLYGRDLAERHSRLKAAYDDYRKALKAPVAAIKLPEVKVETTTPEQVREATRAGQVYARSQVALQHLQKALVHGKAAVALAESSLAMVSGVVGVLGADSTPTWLYAGCDPAGDECAERVRHALKQSDAVVQRMLVAAASVGSAVEGDWAAIAARVLANLPETDGLDCLGKRIGRRMGVLVSIVASDDVEAIAETLDSAAAPIGGWRRKRDEGSRTLSLTALAGLTVGLEQRWGQYGATKEGGRDVYLVAPTLALPFGFEATWGKKGSSVGLFVPLVDPTAFLQYDASNDGKLPGPSLTTALSPGLGLAIGLGNTPFVLTPIVFFRPGLRAWEGAVNAPGANALQFALLLGVDVTLFELHTKDGR